MKIVLPFPLVTWNRLLAMNQWERKKYRDWIHRAVSTLSHTDTALLTPMVSAQRLQSMGLSMREYYAMIRPSSSRKSRTRRSRSAGRKWNGRRSR